MKRDTVAEDVLEIHEANAVHTRPSRPLALLLPLLLSLCALLFTSCAQPVSPTLDLTPLTQTLVSGQTAALTVTRRFPGGPADDVTSSVTYKSSNASIASVDARGIVTAGTEPGVVIIKVYDSISDATALASFTIVASQISSIDVSPSPAIVMPRGTQRLFSALAHFTDGTSRDVTREVLWSSTNEAAAVVGNTSIDKGVVSAVAGGNTTILATDATTLVQGRSIVFVDDAAPQVIAIVVNPNPATLGVGKTFQFGALGVLSDGTTKDLTHSAAWSSSRPDVATVDNQGVVTGITAGDTTITAVAPLPSTGVRGSTAATVTP